MPSISHDEYARRRAAVLDALEGAVGVVFAGKGDPHAMEPWRPHPHFEYLTGITDEQNAVLLLDPSCPDARKREQLFLRPVDPEMSKWDGLRDEIATPLRERTGFRWIYRTYALGRFLNAAARRARRLACLMPLASHTAPVSEDLALFRKLSERIPGCAIEDRSATISRMRARKSDAEVAMIRKAIAITQTGFEAAIGNLRPGMPEFEVQNLLEHAFRGQGSRRLAFSTIAGSGLNSTVLHYRANAGTLGEGELICLDAGATWGGYSADITRTVPTSGAFSPRQREVYEVVLEAMEAAIAATVAGKYLFEIDQAARDVIEAAGYGDYFIHGIGHHLGLETHDASPDEPLDVGAVVTIEPGIYIPDEKIGIRIEDDILVTEAGNENLSPSIPKSVEAIEALMAK